MRGRLDSAAVDPILVPPGEGETVTDRPERTVRILLDHEHADVTWTRYEAGESGPDPHVHDRHYDAFCVLSGELEFGVGGGDRRSIALGAGSFVCIPPGVVHTFRNAGPGAATFLNVHAPSCGFADHLRGLNPDFDQREPPADGGRDPSDVVVTPPGGGEAFVRHNRTITILADVGVLSLLEIAFDSTFVVPPHSHDVEVDAFYVVDGPAEFHVGGEWISAEAGTFVSAVPGAVHGFRCGGERATLLNLHLPDAGFADSVRKD
jgi:quercetin dioxygenase-like cupin family protein